MKANIKYVLDVLTPSSVSLVKQIFSPDGSRVEKTVRSAHINVAAERDILRAELPEDVYAQLLEVWGDSPAFEDPKPFVPSTETRKAAIISDMSSQCNKTITDGFDAIMSDGKTYHFSLTIEDQLMIQALMLKVNAGETILPYHADGETCRYFSPDEVRTLYKCSESRILYNTTYFNSLRDYINSIDDISKLSEVSYGMEIPEEFKSDVLKMLEAN